ncbi:hypothetical protein ACHAP8_010300 [Fusarium lateritium]
MRVTTNFGSLILSASLVAARFQACAPHPRPTTTTAATGVDTTTDVESFSTIATATSGLTTEETTIVTESQTDVESSVTVSTSLTTTEFDTAVTSSVTLSTFETSTTSADATSEATEATTTTASPPAENTNIVQNAGFEDSTIEPWEVTGTNPNIQDNFGSEGSKSLSLPQEFTNSAAKICQSVAIEQGFEYTFKASVAQNCIFSFGSNIVSCEDNANKIQLTIDAVSDSGDLGVLGYNTFNEVSDTFSYIGPSVEQTALCVTIKVIDAAYYNFYLDGISLVRGKAVALPEET